MAASIIQGVELYVDGFNPACAFRSLSIGKEADELESTSLCSNGNRTFKLGLKQGKMDLSGFYDYDGTDADETGNILNSAFDNQNQLVVSAGFAAIAAGGEAWLCRGGQVQHDVESVLNQIVMTSANIRAEDNVHRGVWLLDTNADGTTSTGSSVDNTSGTTNGGILHFHVWEESDSDATDAAITVEESSNDSDWSDLISETALGAASGALAIEVARGTSVARYLRATLTATGGKAYAVAAFKRYI